MRPTAHTLAILPATLVLAACYFGCRGGLPPSGPLPPTELPSVTDEAGPEARTNDAPILGPVAGDDVATGGTSVLPKPPAPGPGGSGMGGTGAGGSGSTG